MELSKPVKILLAIGAIVIVAVAIYLFYPSGPETTEVRGVQRAAPTATE
jgi:hypothetical protein